jgi:hypothetical protein
VIITLFPIFDDIMNDAKGWRTGDTNIPSLIQVLPLSRFS